jgi:hypothetical protein
VKQSRVAYAAVVLKHAPELRDGVLSGAMQLGAAYEQALSRAAIPASEVERVAEFPPPHRTGASFGSLILIRDMARFVEARYFSWHRPMMRKCNGPSRLGMAGVAPSRVLDCGLPGPCRHPGLAHGWALWNQPRPYGDRHITAAVHTNSSGWLPPSPNRRMREGNGRMTTEGYPTSQGRIAHTETMGR